MEDPFFENLKGSVSGNLVTGAFFVLFWVLKNKCRHCKCSSNTSLCACEINDESQGEIDLERGENTCQIEESVQELQSPNHKNVPSIYTPVIQTYRGHRGAINIQVADD